MLPLPRLAGALFEALDSVRHGFYGRRGGVSTGVFESLNCSPFSGDLTTSVAANRQRVADDLGATQLFTNHQIHGNRVRVIKADTDPDEIFDGDGMVTNEAQLALGVLAADCAPVLFADPQARIIGAAHAGWKGALLGVTDSVIEKMMLLGAQPDNILCAIGPAIQLQSYQVGEELFERFQAESPMPCMECFRKSAGNDDANKNSYHFDLPRYLQMRIAAAGVSSCETLADDTWADEMRFFSYRRNCQQAGQQGEVQYGRQIAAIVLV